MIAILLAWVSMFVVFYGFGQMSLRLSQNLFRNKKNINPEAYNVLDSLLIGMSAIVLLLQIWSLFMPANHVFLGLAVFLSLIYLAFNRGWVARWTNFSIKYLSLSQWFVILLFVALAFASNLMMQGSFDSEFYHAPAIRWNVEYPVIPGLGNLEDRLAFNSSYFLLSAMFSYLFLWGEPIYGIQLFVFVAFVVWALVKLFKSNYTSKSVVLFASVILFVGLYVSLVVATSTDILPNVIFLYMCAIVFVDSKTFEDKRLMFICLPLLIITLKISLAPIGVVFLYSFYLLYKQKETRAATALLLVSSLIVVFWLVRNIILSGYLIYPMYSLDIFSFDWKIPREVAILQKDYIRDYATSVWTNLIEHLFQKEGGPLWLQIIHLATITLLFLSLLCLPFYFITKYRKKQFDFPQLYLALASVLIILFSFFNGSDLRFIGGVATALILLGGIGACSFCKIEKLKWLKYPSLLAFFVIYFIWTSSYVRDHSSAISEYYSEPVGRPLSSVLQTPYPAHDYMLVMGYINLDSTIVADKIDNKIDVNVSTSVWGKNTFPLVHKPIDAHFTVFVDYRCLQARGETIEDGFKMDTTCMNESLKDIKKALQEAGY